MVHLREEEMIIFVQGNEVLYLLDKTTILVVDKTPPHDRIIIFKIGIMITHDMDKDKTQFKVLLTNK